jgi:glyoxylase-like metal-dependent hydrolase (beta-lactamase superfamily II)
MSEARQFNDVIFQAQIALTAAIPLHVYLVKGDRYAVWIDSGIRSMFPLLQETMALANVAPSKLRFILHTHSHHDHIGCNAQLQAYTGCLIAAHPHYAAWHADFERHYHEFARGVPNLIPDTPALRSEVLDILDAPAPLDVHLPEQPTAFDLGGVTLRSLWLPGHLLAEFAWYEESTRTLILGDAITGLDWALFHSHLSVQGYRDSLLQLRHFLLTTPAAAVVAAHYAPMTPAEALALCDKADAYIDVIEAALIRILAEGETVTLERLWSELCRRLGRTQEFRALNMVRAHLADLETRGIVAAAGEQTYRLR